MAEPAFLSGRDALLCHSRAEHSIGDVILLLLKNKAQSKMLLSFLTILLEETQNACLVGTMIGIMLFHSYIAPSADMYCERLHQEYSSTRQE